MKKEWIKQVDLIFGKKVHHMEELVGMLHRFQFKDRSIILLMAGLWSMILFRRKILLLDDDENS